MARCPFATFRGPVPNETPAGMIAHRGLVLHVEQGTEAGTDSWFHNPAAKVSAHFGVATDGTLDQWVDTDDKAWAEAAGNPSWLSVEIAGRSGQTATAAQVATLGRLYGWAAARYGWPLAATDDPAGAGLGWHGMGGQAWGGHLDCPGGPIKAQRPAILAAAGPPPTPAPTPPVPPQHSEIAVDMATLTTSTFPFPEPPTPAGAGWCHVDIPFEQVTGVFGQAGNESRGERWPKVVPVASADGDGTWVGLQILDYQAGNPVHPGFTVKHVAGT